MTRGLYRRGESVMYVNRDLGVGGPALRINCPREIATLELMPQRAEGERSPEPECERTASARPGAAGLR